jgi:GAF domain-containing protein
VEATEDWDPHLDELSTLAGLALHQTDLSATLIEICRVATRAVPGAEGASITTINQGQPTALASDEWALGLDELQYSEHEGPCLDAYRTGNAFRVNDFTVETRWPAYGPRAAERGAISMISVPMAAESKVVGAVNLYARSQAVFDGHAVSIAQVVAAHAGLASQVAAAFFGHKDLSDNLAAAMRSRATIEQAKGILMDRRNCGPDDAFDVMVQLSSTSNRKLRDVAAALVDEASGATGTPA